MLLVVIESVNKLFNAPAEWVTAFRKPLSYGTSWCIAPVQNTFPKLVDAYMISTLVPGVWDQTGHSFCFAGYGILHHAFT